MSDYFAALAARTLQPELGVQPRRRVRWEEASPALDLAEELPRRAIAAQAGPPASPEADDRRRSMRALDAEPVVVDDETTPRARRPRPLTRIEDHDDAGVLTFVTLPPAAVKGRGPAQPVQPLVVQPPLGPPSVATRSGVDGRPRADSQPRAGEQVHGGPARISVRQRARAASEPAIRIHIGRVDVRAVTGPPPGPPSPRESTRPLMSLDEYVQKRDRGVS